MSKLNRAAQLSILRAMEARFPLGLLQEDLESLNRDHGKGTIATEAVYLAEHGLVQSGASITPGGAVLLLARNMKITAKGLDFLAEDGGLGAVLDVLTVKLHSDTIRALIDRVQNSDADTSVKGKLISQLKALPAEEAARLTSKAVDVGLQHLPNVVPWLQTIVSNL